MPWPLFFILAVATAFNNPPGVDIWCGKAYRATNASFEPGGWLEQPARSAVPLLDLRIRPRMNLYTADDDRGALVIDAAISHLRGQPLSGEPFDTSEPQSRKLRLEVSVDGTAVRLEHVVTVDSTSVELDFPLCDLEPRFQPWNVSLKAIQGNQVLIARTQVYRLPDRTDGGSVTKIDSLHGGLMVRNSSSSPASWVPLLPYSFYVSWDGWLEKSLDNVQNFKDQGYNIIHIVPNAGLANQAFNFTELNLFLDKCDEVGLWVMYDMRWTYKNLTSVREQVNMLNARKSLLLWYTGDEPDGQSDPLDATKITYDLIKSIDPWHPVSLVLNCYNFYYEEYSSGADIILSDVYPLAVNTSWSTVYDTPCNTTYGCCGCDDCEGNLQDISVRLDRFSEYQSWVSSVPKPLWGVPMAFGNETFWSRYPTADEEVSMTMLSLNHNAKGIVMWDYPTTAELAQVTSRLSRVLTGEPVSRFLLGAPTVPLHATGHPNMDIASWRVGSQMLVSVVSLQSTSWEAQVTVPLPAGARAVSRVLWGSKEWGLSGGCLSKKGGRGLETDLIVVDF
ncbi:Glycoside hydrolase superfamily protein [Penicillium ucsense]|uniref:Glycoside hydrolase superfamily protein n=1 Tax=Penicillium ucsense TaxID=2839758 RepID=A0A8J8W8V2_9EURO|nr:Glycoside hydrolase superfamily protein [Penicillium ucsense]KAF7739431.1 Glycoside hydrolase superfamily protein [Penicillium ucsense]